MRVFLSAVENTDASKTEGGYPIVQRIVGDGLQMKWNLMSYYYIQSGNREWLAEFIRDNSELVLVDSGAHTFQFGRKVDWDEYTKQFAHFIESFDSPKVLGYFEMDIENVVGFGKVLELRSILEDVTDKIIPVWHPLRGIGNYEEMCEQYSGKIIAIGGFKGSDIRDDQYLSFLKVARKHNCKVHCLGMTRAEVLDKVPFDTVDSRTWVNGVMFGKIGYGRFAKGKVSKEYSRHNRGEVLVECYKCGMQMQEYYYNLWRRECRD